MPYLYFQLNEPDERIAEYRRLLCNYSGACRSCAELIVRALELMSVTQPNDGHYFHGVVTMLARHVAEQIDAISVLVREGWLFQTRRNSKFTPRRVQQIVKKYAEQAGVKATPHSFRHQCITWLTRHSGLADAELQLITGHSRRETLAVYQHVALDGGLEAKYQEAMSKAGL